MRHVILSTPFCDMCRAERELLNLFESINFVFSFLFDPITLSFAMVSENPDCSSSFGRPAAFFLLRDCWSPSSLYLCFFLPLLSLLHFVSFLGDYVSLRLRAGWIWRVGLETPEKRGEGADPLGV
ncbi:hypothetical protein YC2023_116204 [Brassica napus]